MLEFVISMFLDFCSQILRFRSWVETVGGCPELVALQGQGIVGTVAEVAQVGFSIVSVTFHGSTL